MSERMPDVIYVTPDLAVSFLDIFENRGKYLLESHVEATTVPKAEHESARETLAMIAYKTDGAGGVETAVLENHALTAFDKLKADSVPRDKVEALIEKYNILLDAAKDYWDYEHDGDPFTEDARAMGEMTLDEIKPGSGENEFEQAIAAIRSLEDKR